MCGDFSGQCGALFIVWGVVGAGVLGLYVDRSKKFTEVTKINLSLSAMACAAFSVVALMPGQHAAVAVVCSLFGFFGFSVYPVAMELSVECSYPVGEATSAGLIFASGKDMSPAEVASPTGNEHSNHRLAPWQRVNRENQEKPKREQPQPQQHAAPAATPPAGAHQEKCSNGPGLNHGSYYKKITRLNPQSPSSMPE
uniref:Uncharacterized protein n=1 Tax=Knipowitschia caucasica TaxID=637954 RepID=A0AAV2MI46_KNICA